MKKAKLKNSQIIFLAILLLVSISAKPYPRNLYPGSERMDYVIDPHNPLNIYKDVYCPTHAEGVWHKSCSDCRASE